MKSVTITPADELAAWARVEAAKAGKSLSRYIGDRLADEMRDKTDQIAALEAFLSGPGFAGVAANLPNREELYAEGEDELLRRNVSAESKR
jgi:hypothetical protein